MIIFVVEELQIKSVQFDQFFLLVAIQLAQIRFGHSICRFVLGPVDSFWFDDMLNAYNQTYI